MRWIQPGLVGIIAMGLFLAVVGCNSDSGGDVSKQEMQNPTGQPRDAQEQQMHDLQQQAGESAKKRMEEAARAEAEAKAKAGIK